jgi:hypothetical protein
MGIQTHNMQESRVEVCPGTQIHLGPSSTQPVVMSDSAGDNRSRRCTLHG